MIRGSIELKNEQDNYIELETLKLNNIILYVYTSVVSLIGLNPLVWVFIGF